MSISHKIETLLQEQYGLNVSSIKCMTTGVGGDTFLIKSMQGKYVFKLAEMNAMNRPEMEPDLCNYLLQYEIPASLFCRNKDNNCITLVEGKVGLLQCFIEGTVYAMNSAPDWFMQQSPLLLGKIHQTLSTYVDLPYGLGKEFFYYMTLENARQSYGQSLNIALERTEENIIEDLEFRIKLTETIPKMGFEPDLLTYRNTHGDYTINQILCGDSTINGIIDWTSACKHPVIWEITRSFFYAEPSCKEGDLDDRKFNDYVNTYCSMIKLTDYDRENIIRLYYYQLAVCDYYHQYLFAEASKKEEFLSQAKFATNVLRKQNERAFSNY